MTLGKQKMEKNNITFRKAKTADTERIMDIIEQNKVLMWKAGNHQWDENYPALVHIKGDIEKGVGYVMEQDGNVIAYAAVVFTGEPTYNKINGKWLSSIPYVVVHRLCVAPEMKGQGLAKRYMLQVEEMSKERGVFSCRVDTNYSNPAMLHIIQELGYTYCGEIEYNHGMRKAFEKLLNHQ